MGFSQFGLRAELTQSLQEIGFTVPTPIQRDSIPHGLAGRDVLGLAQTGTGKTAAFALPILQRLMDGPRGKVRALVVAPTRELAEQIRESFQKLGRHARLRAACVYGGVGFGPQEQALRGGAEIIVACPGRLLDHMGQGTANLSAVEVLVLDEADQMFDMGFLPSIEKILARLPKTRQTLLFSATMPGEIRHLAHKCLNNPITVQVDHTVPLTTVTHGLYPVREHLKTDLLLELIRRAGSGSVLVFTRTKHRAKKLGKRLVDAGLDASSLQGNLSQNQRRKALDGFRDGSYQILVATDIAARGIDISEISHVINYDVPTTPELYTHRIGRTGRAAKTGDAFTLVTDADGDMIRTIEKTMGKKIEVRRLEGFDYAKAQPHGQPHDGGGRPHGRIKHPRGGPKRHSHGPAHPPRHHGGGHGGHGGHGGQGGGSHQPQARPQPPAAPGRGGRKSVRRRFF